LGLPPRGRRRKALSPNTITGYTADWSLFTDWCAATNRVTFPADWATITAFTAACPGAPVTVRRRLAAIAHRHRVAGHPAPADPAQQAGSPLRKLIDPGQAEMLMRLLPSHGWTAGLFGRRDRALLALAAQTTIPYRQLPRLTVEHLHIADGVATITDYHGCHSRRQVAGFRVRTCQPIPRFTVLAVGEPPVAGPQL